MLVRRKSRISFFILLLVLISLFILMKKNFSSNELLIPVELDQGIALRASDLVNVTVTPAFNYSFTTMTKGAIQHLDRNYTYDNIPEVLEGGLLFQGIHRPPKGTSIRLEVRKPATVYFFFHSRVDGGYSQIFAGLPAWKKHDQAPQYDVKNGDHGLDMTMYFMHVDPGSYSIPATTADRACFSIVFQEH